MSSGPESVLYVVGKKVELATAMADRPSSGVPDNVHPVTSGASDMRHLRPMTSPELLDRAFAVLGARWSVVVPCALLLASSGVLQAYLATRNAIAPDGAMLLIFLLLLLLGELAAAIALVTSFQAWLYPKRLLDFEPLVKASLNRLFPFVVTRLVFDFVGMMLVLSIPAWLLTKGVQSYPPLLCSILAAATIMIGVGVLLHWALASIVVLVERKGLFTGLNRSLELMRTGSTGILNPPPPVRRLLPALLSLLLVAVTAAGVTHLLYLRATGNVLHERLFSKGFAGDVQFAILAAEAAVMALVFPLLWPFITVLYTDCRIRREGLDFQMRLLENGGWEGNALDQESLAGA